MDLQISLGNVLTILTIIIGFMWQHFSMVERIAKAEIEIKNVKHRIDLHDKDLQHIRAIVCRGIKLPDGNLQGE